MRGADFEAERHRLARAYALIRPDGPAWLAAWQAGDAWAADELSEWELEGHPFHPSTWSTTNMKTVIEVLDGMLALYAAPGTWSRNGTGEDGTWNLEAALYRVVGDPEADGITDDEWRRREALASGVFSACGVDLMALNDAARHQRAVVAVLRSGRAEQI